MKVIICLNPFISHYIPTVAMAMRMKELGHEVIYIGFQDAKSYIAQEQFRFYFLNSCSNNDLIRLQRQHKYYEMGLLYQQLHKEMVEILDKCKADIALIGVSRVYIYLPAMFSKNIKIVLYKLCAGVPSLNKHYPPITSSYIPIFNKKFDIMSILHWEIRLLRKGLSIPTVISKFFYPYTILRKQCGECKIPWKFGIDGFYPSFPMITFGTEYFEFCENKFSIYTGLGIEGESDQNEKMQFPFKVKDQPLIYCCLGTMAARYMNANTFLVALIELFKENSQWNLIISLGEKGASIDIEIKEDNIYVVDYINQRLLLKSVDLVLTHGGYGTIKECIFNKVPMVVLPCSYDQHGNAARIQYNGIGIRSSLMKKTWYQRIFHRGEKSIRGEDIKTLIEEGLNNKTYYNNICKLMQKVKANNELENAIKYLELL